MSCFAVIVGGVLLLVRNSITAIHRKDSNCEMLWIELHTSQRMINLVAYYRPPSAAVDSLQSLYSALSAASTSHPVVVCGDFNVPGVDWATSTPTVKSPVTETLCRFVCDNFLTQLVSTPTRGDSILDSAYLQYRSNFICWSYG